MATENDEKKAEGRVGLSLDELEGVSGGYIVHRTSRPASPFCSPYMIVDDKTGRKLGYEDTLDAARKSAGWFDANTEVISEEQYEQRFGQSAYNS